MFIRNKVKEVISKCDEFNYAFQEILEKYENKTKKQIGRMKETTNKLFIVIPKDNDNENKNEKNPKKKSSKKETKKPETEKKPKKKTSKKKSMNAP